MPIMTAFSSASGSASWTLKGDLAVRPIFHQREARIEAHIFIAFLAYCLHVTLKRRLAALAPGLTPRSVLEKFSAVQMIDAIVPTTDGRELQLTRTTQPDPCCLAYNMPSGHVWCRKSCGDREWWAHAGWPRAGNPYSRT